MSSARKKRSRLEVWGFLAVGVMLTGWYAYPQILFSLYPAYELARLLFPSYLPDLAPVAGAILDHLGIPR